MDGRTPRGHYPTAKPPKAARYGSKIQPRLQLPKLRVVKRNPFLVFGRSRILHLPQRRPSFVQLRQQDRKLLMRQIQFRLRHLIRQFAFASS